MGLANVILGVKITRTQNGLVLSQSHYVDEILEKFNARDTSVAQTPIDTSQHFCQIIELDLAYDVSRLSRYTSNPSSEHWKSMIRLLRYLRYTRSYGLHYGQDPTVVEGYNDVTWIFDIKDSKSTSGYVFTLG
ncbi:secreted RxLR effector protein 161-like [Bidens hawaiensis]|uniref:secreted RxLR effector protein 161-like n=1 Tax=Bidens hawaiensis TaxID=980011 RepID=UPI00404A977E